MSVKIPTVFTFTGNGSSQTQSNVSPPHQGREPQHSEAPPFPSAWGQGVPIPFSRDPASPLNLPPPPWQCPGRRGCLLLLWLRKLPNFEKWAGCQGQAGVTPRTGRAVHLVVEDAQTDPMSVPVFVPLCPTSCFSHFGPPHCKGLISQPR